MVKVNRVFPRLTSLLIVLFGVSIANGASFVVTRTDDRNETCNSGVDCSLREAVNAARTGAGDDTVTFASGLSQITLTSEIAMVSPSGWIFISGGGANVLTIDGGPGTNRIFSLLGANVVLSGMTLTGGNGVGTERSGFGGAIHVTLGSLTVDGLHITGNSTSSAGGAISIESGGNHRIVNSTISANTAFDCGGIGNHGGAQTYISNTTITGNTVSQLGGGLCANSNTALRNVSIVSNSSGSTAGGILKSASGNLTMGNTIVAGNNPADIRFIQHPGNIISEGNNLIGDAPGDAANTGLPIAYQTSDILDAPLFLGPLRNHGGIVPARAYLAWSPAIDGGANSLAFDPLTGAPLTTDQRGFPRIIDGDGNGTSAVDIGAFEVRSLVVANANDSGTASLRQAMSDVVTQGDAIVFNPEVFGSSQIITLTTGDLVLPANAFCAVLGPGTNRLTISGNSQSRVFSTDTGAYLGLSDFRITGGNGVGAHTANGGGAIFNKEGFLSIKNVILADNQASPLSGTGGAIYNLRGTTRIFDSVLTQNTAGSPDGGAGAVYNSGLGGSLEIVNSTIFDNFAGLGAGIYNDGTAIISKTSFISNDATASGGGLYNNGTASITSAIFESNTAVNTGGGIFSTESSTLNAIGSLIVGNSTGSQGTGGGIMSGGTVTLDACRVSRNTGGTHGGGIANGLGNLTLTRSTVDGNVAGASGGGITSSGGLVITNSTISGNQASQSGGGLFVEVFVPGGATMTHVTVAYNSAANGGGLRCLSGSVTSRNSIYANNTATVAGPDFQANMASQGYNLIENAAGTVISGVTTGNILGVDPLLDPILRLNGSSVYTHALRINSPAIDKGGSGTSTDQRAFARPVEFPSIPNAPGGNGSDIGSFERQTFDASASSPFDFDGDGKTDIAIFRPSVAEWWVNRSGTGVTWAAQFGATTDSIVPGDFTGDGKADVAIWRPASGEWFVLRSEDFSYFSFPFGTNGDVPAPADYDGDGKTDATVFRPSNSTWYVRRSSDSGTTIQQFGAAGDVPVPSDYDGDGKADIAIFRPSEGQWWMNRSTAGVLAVTFGNSSDKLVQGDYTGDGKSDNALFRPSTGEWFILRSDDFSFYSFPFGTSTDIPAPGDYDGDGKFDATVFRPSSATWYSQRTTAGTLIQQFGANGDRPVPNAFVP